MTTPKTIQLSGILDTRAPAPAQAYGRPRPGVRSLAAQDVDVEARTITGMILPYDVVGYTDVGPVIVKAGALRLPDDLSRVKLFGKGHDRETPVGYLVEVADSPEGLRGQFRIAETPDGDLALAEAAGKVRDAFSVELDEITVEDEAAEVLVATDAFLRGVALLTVPAFDDARVAASRSKGSPTMEPCDICGLTHDAAVSCVDARAAAAVAAPTEPAAGAEAAMVPAAAPAAAAPAVQAAAAPIGLQATSTRPRQAFASKSDFFEALSLVHSGRAGARGAELKAALLNVTQSAVGVDVEQPQWVGELWDGVEYRRKIVPLFGTIKELTSYTVDGWKWTTKPAVAVYSGDKAAVPSNQPATDPSSTPAERLAGAHDHDRKFVDFKNTSYFESYYAAMSESYARLSDANALSSALTFATDIATPDYEGFLGAIAAGVEAIDDATNAESTFVVANKSDLIPWVLGLTASGMVPSEMLKLIGVNIDRVVTHSGMTAGHVLVGVSNAMDYYELPGSPIRVEAVDMVNGGVDTGVFGYHAEVLHDAEGLQDVVIDPVGA